MYDDILGKREKKVKLVKLTLKWDAVPCSNVIGYNLYYRKIGISKQTVGKRFNRINVGSNTSYTLSLKPNTTYELTVTAYDVHGSESKRSEMIIYKPKESK